MGRKRGRAGDERYFFSARLRSSRHQLAFRSSPLRESLQQASSLEAVIFRLVIFSSRLLQHKKGPHGELHDKISRDQETCLESS